MSGLNWDVELRKVERAFDGLPPEPTAGELSARRSRERLAQQRQDAVNATIGAWVRLLLVAGLAVGLYFWPYARECGAGLFVYIGAASVISAGALWVVAWTWRWRMAKTHGLALLMVLWSLVLIGTQVLPRIGYAKVDPRHPQVWRCQSTALH